MSLTLFVSLFRLSRSNATSTCGSVMDELAFLFYSWGRSHDFRFFSTPAITLVCSWLGGRPQIFTAPAKTGLLLIREEIVVFKTRLASGGRADYPHRGFIIFSPQLEACELITKFLRPLSTRCERRRRLPLLRIGLLGKIVEVILHWWGIVLPVWLIPPILGRSLGPFRVVFPTWSLLAPQIPDSKAGCDFHRLRFLSTRAMPRALCPYWV